jgi:hypothetical protein
MKMAVFWDVPPCSVEDIHQSFRGVYCLHHQGNPSLSGLKMEAVCSPESLMYVQIHTALQPERPTIKECRIEFPSLKKKIHEDCSLLGCSTV